MVAHSISIGLVGPCSSGKTTIKGLLRNHGFNVKHIAQEHSYVKDMWKKIANPDILVYLNVAYPTTLQRKNLDWSYDEYLEQITRLSHAHNFADLIIETDSLSPQQVLDKILDFIVFSD
jgi:hypothetical protein